jgi:hypothetical protein
VILPNQGDVLILPTGAAPVAGTNGHSRGTFRHGVATLAWGERFTLGIVLHDAR